MPGVAGFASQVVRVSSLARVLAYLTAMIRQLLVFLAATLLLWLPGAAQQARQTSIIRGTTNLTDLIVAFPSIVTGIDEIANELEVCWR